jgi:hypothetical protein
VQDSLVFPSGFHKKGRPANLQSAETAFNQTGTSPEIPQIFQASARSGAKVKKFDHQGSGLPER